MRAAILLLWASCLYMLARSVLCLLLTASPWRRLAVLAHQGDEHLQGVGLLDQIQQGGARQAHGPALLPLAGLVLLFVSYLISCRVAAGKEY